MKKIITLLFLFFSVLSFAQIKGTVTDSKGNPIPFANIYVKDTYISTTTNEQGKYTLNLKTEGSFVILFQYLGYKTEKKVIQYNNTAQVIDVVLNEEELLTKNFTKIMFFCTELTEVSQRLFLLNYFFMI